MELSTFQKVFHTVFAKYLNNKSVYIRERISTNPSIQQRLDHVYHVCLSGGKRMRPYLAYIVYEGCGGKHTDAMMQASVSCELIHSLALMVDDIIDIADTRHGVPTTHKRLQNTQQQTELFSHMHTVLMSDLLYNRVFDNINQQKVFGFEQLHAGVQYLHYALDEVIIGEMIDVILQGDNGAQKADIIEKDYLKTASYSCIRPMQFGAALAGAGDILIKQLEDLGKNIGLAFQLMDDLADFYSLHKDKPVMADLQEGQQTLITVLFLEQANDTQRAEFADYFGKKLTQQQQKHAFSLIHDSGVCQHVLNQLHEHISSAKTILSHINITPDAKNSISSILTMIEKKVSTI